MANLKASIRWTQATACKEFGMHQDTFAKRWRQREVPPRDDDTWSTKEVVSIIFGDVAGEKLRLVTAQADKITLENDEKKRGLIPVDTVLIAGQRFVGAAKSRILASSMTDAEKDLVLQDLASLATAKMIDVSDP